MWYGRRSCGSARPTWQKRTKHWLAVWMRWPRTAQAKELGFDGKTLIHPKTIAKANEVFAPSPEDVASSRKIIAAHTEASRAGKGVILVEGKLIENLHVEGAKRLVALADAINALETAASAMAPD